MRGNMIHPKTLPDDSVELLTIREHFACEAMQGMLARGHAKSRIEIIEDAVDMADLLIAALNKPSVEESRERERTND